MSNCEEPEIPVIKPSPNNSVCSECGSAEVECLDWVRVNDNLFVGGNQVFSSDDYWCQDCEMHDKPIAAREYCESNGHRGRPCSVCGAH